MANHGTVKQKSHRAASKRFRISKGGKSIRRHAMQDHNNVGRSKKTIRGRRRDRPVAASDLHRITALLPFVGSRIRK